MKLTLKGRKVLVTGGFGFIGINLVKRLLQEGAIVTIISRRRRKNKSIPLFMKDVRVVYGDVGDSLVLDKAIAGNDVVYHLAASVPFSKVKKYSSESSIADIKIIARLVKLAASKKVKKIVFLSGHVVYANPVNLPISEKAPLGPQGIYGASKLCCEHYLEVLCRENNVGYCVLRASSCYGPYQSSIGVIPNFINAALHDKALKISNKDVKRDYIFVDDLVSAMIDCVASTGKIYNVGGGKSSRILDIARIVCHVIGKGKIKAFDSSVDVLDNVLDITKAGKDFGFAPKVDIIAGLRRQVDWVKGGHRKRIYFDLDGTLFSCKERLYTLHKDLLKELKIQDGPSLKEYFNLKMAKVPEKEIMSRYIRNRDKLAKYLKKRLELIEDEHYLKFSKPFIGISELLRRLSKDYVLILLTKRKSEAAVKGQLAEWGLAGLFEEVLVAGKAVNFDKANLIKDRFNDNSLIVGDTEEDVLLGNSLGMPVIAVCWGMRSKNLLRKSGAKHLVTKVSDLGRSIRSLH